MSTLIFCSDCGSDLLLDAPSCSCGNQNRLATLEFEDLGEESSTSRGRRLWFAVAGLVVAVAGVAGWFFLRGPSCSIGDESCRIVEVRLRHDLPRDEWVEDFADQLGVSIDSPDLPPLIRIHDWVAEAALDMLFAEGDQSQIEGGPVPCRRISECLQLSRDGQTPEFRGVGNVVGDSLDAEYLPYGIEVESLVSELRLTRSVPSEVLTQDFVRSAESGDTVIRVIVGSRGKMLKVRVLLRLMSGELAGSASSISLRATVGGVTLDSSGPVIRVLPNATLGEWGRMELSAAGAMPAPRQLVGSWPELDPVLTTVRDLTRPDLRPVLITPCIGEPALQLPVDSRCRVFIQGWSRFGDDEVPIISRGDWPDDQIESLIEGFRRENRPAIVLASTIGTGRCPTAGCR